MNGAIGWGVVGRSMGVGVVASRGTGTGEREGLGRGWNATAIRDGVNMNNAMTN